jgi:hypothetical protein
MIIFFIWSIFCSAVEGIRSSRFTGDELVPDYSEFYYYHNLNEKLGETLSVNNCTTSGDHTGFEPTNGKSADFDITIIRPSTAVTNRWGTQGREIFNMSKIYSRTTPNLCGSPAFLDFKRGSILYTKGCLKMFRYDVLGRRVKVINRYGATLHPEHVRCSIKKASSQCVAASTHPLQLPNEFRSLNSYPFMINVKRAIVSRSGFLALPCGPLGLFSSCEAVKYGIPSSSALLNSVQQCRNSETSASAHGEDNCPYPSYDKVFVMTQYDDTQIGQFIQEALPRLVYHLDFIKANPDIVIHYGFTKQDFLPAFVLPHLIFEWLGVADRLVNGTVYGKEIYMPREGGCQDAGYNAWEVVTTREIFLKIAKVDQDDYSSQRSIVVIRRSASPYTRNQSDYRARRWPLLALKQMLELLRKAFPKHKIEVYSDLNKELMDSREAQIRMFHNADVVIAVHGAGLTNTMYMRPGGVVVEVIPYFDSRHAPVIGIFPRLSGIIGLNHYTYFHGPMKGFEPTKLVAETADFAKAVGVQ